MGQNKTCSLKNKLRQYTFYTVDKSLMQIKNNKGPRIESQETPAITETHPKAWPFTTTI